MIGSSPTRATTFPSVSGLDEADFGFEHPALVINDAATIHTQQENGTRGATGFDSVKGSVSILQHLLRRREQHTVFVEAGEAVVQVVAVQVGAAVLGARGPVAVAVVAIAHAASGRVREEYKTQYKALRKERFL